MPVIKIYGYEKFIAQLEPNGQILTRVSIQRAILAAIRTVATDPKFNCLAELDAQIPDAKAKVSSESASSFINSRSNVFQNTFARHGLELTKVQKGAKFYIYQPTESTSSEAKESRFQFDRAVVEFLIDAELDSDNFAPFFAKYNGMLAAIKDEAKKSLGFGVEQTQLPSAAAAKTEPSSLEKLANANSISAIAMLSLFVANIGELMPQVLTLSEACLKNTKAIALLEPTKIRGSLELFSGEKEVISVRLNIGITTEEYDALDKRTLCTAMKEIVEKIITNRLDSRNASFSVLKTPNYDFITTMPSLEEMLKIQTGLLTPFVKQVAKPR